MSGVRLPKAHQREHRDLTAEQFDALAGAAGDGRLLVLMLGWCGLRRSAAVGLRTRDVDLLRRRLVRRAVVEVGSDLVPGTPKTHRTRDVPLPPWLTDPLAQHLAGRSADDPVFANTEGGLLRSANWKRRVWDRAVSETGRPSDALAASETADQAFTSLLVGLGAVALLVSGIGVANTMVISVLERRSEIGLRRALGATKGQVRLQFLSESVILSVLGGLTGEILGAAATAIYASTRQWPTTVPLWALGGGVTATILPGAVAGLYPFARAARSSPTTALSSP